MTENEAIERLECMRLFMQINDSASESKFLEEDYIANKMAIKALEEAQQYRAIGTVEQLLDMKQNYAEALSDWRQYRKIGTVEECREAMERQKAKKPTLYGDFEDGKLICPNCEEDLMDLAECGFNCCPYCGQAIDWGDTD